MSDQQDKVNAAFDKVFGNPRAAETQSTLYEQAERMYADMAARGGMPKFDVAKFGAQVRIKRRARGLSRDTLATIVGCAGATITYVEKNAHHTGPSLLVALKLAFALDISLDEVCKF